MIRLKIPYRQVRGGFFEPVVNLEIWGRDRKFHKVAFLFDTGAAISIVSYNLIRRLAEKSTEFDGKGPIVYQSSAQGQTILQRSEITCRLGGKEFPMVVAFSRRASDYCRMNLLGRNILKFFNVFLKEKEMEITAKTSKTFKKRILPPDPDLSSSILEGP